MICIVDRVGAAGRAAPTVLFCSSVIRIRIAVIQWQSLQYSVRQNADSNHIY